MLDTQLEPGETRDEADRSRLETDGTIPTEAEMTDEELADEVVVEISVDGMCGVY